MTAPGRSAIEPTVPSEELALAALDLARSFAAGATMWCVAPEWPAHGDHVAVEFVHPVIVGKRALPAVHLERGSAVTALRLLGRPGDVVLAIGSSAEREICSLMRRVEAWGMSSLWIGTGPRPDQSADHVIWLEDAEPAIAARDGDLVLMYHLLWELTHVVFEHPGLLQGGENCEDEVCVTCSDEARVAEVRALSDGGFAEVVCGGQQERVEVSLVEPVGPGDLLLVHAGVAITALDESVSPREVGS